MRVWSATLKMRRATVRDLVATLGTASEPSRFALATDVSRCESHAYRANRTHGHVRKLLTADGAALPPASERASTIRLLAPAREHFCSSLAISATRGRMDGVDVGARRSADARGRAQVRSILVTRAPLRAARYQTWDDLHAAVLVECERQILAENPSFDVTKFMSEMLARVEQTPAGAPGTPLFRALRDAAAAAIDYVERPGPGTALGLHTELLAALFSSSLIDASGERHAIRPFFRTWGRGHRSERAADKWGVRTKIIRLFHGVPDAAWWVGRKPTERDLAIVTLLSGCVPKGIRERQEESTGGADAPLVVDVMDAEESAVRVSIGRIQKSRRQRSTR